MPEQARALAARLMATWAGGPTAEVWVEELEPLDEGTANTAFVRLRRELERAPSVKRFLDMYHSLRTATTDPVRVDCPHCEGTGMVEVVASSVRGPDDDEAFEHRYGEVGPCTCAAGRRMAPMFARNFPARPKPEGEVTRQRELF